MTLPDITPLKTLLGKERCLTAPEDLLAYSYDMFGRGNPELVVLPQTTAEVSCILAFAHTHRIPVVPRGSGTSLAGGPVAVQGGIVMSMTKMNQILEISPTDRMVVTQPGVVTGDLQARVLKQGLFYPPNPTSAAYCTIGGNIATNAGGASGVKYGVTANYILGLTVVLADGRVVETGNSCIKSVTGFDFKRAFCGSEGLLGVITQARLRLIPAPATPVTGLAYFSGLEPAAAAVQAVIRSGLVPSTMELMDQAFLSAVSQVYGIELPPGAGAALLVEFDDGPALWALQQEKLKTALKDSLSLIFAQSQAQREVLWQARKGGTAALVKSAKFIQTLDFAVPVSRIAEAVRGLQKISRTHDLEMVLIGHAGDGNLHPMFIYDPDDPVQKENFHTAEKKMCALILSMAGTLSGEHGIGMEKAMYIEDELSQGEMELGRQLKAVLDPRGILNPGKCGF